MCTELDVLLVELAGKEIVELELPNGYVAFVI
jgi:hypothetical protein